MRNALRIAGLVAQHGPAGDREHDARDADVSIGAHIGGPLAGLAVGRAFECGRSRALASQAA